MAYADLLINTCTIRRFTEGAIDAYGTPVKTWADHLADEPCRYSTPTNVGMFGLNREIKVGAEVVVADLTLFTLDIDITEQDQVVLETRTYEVLSVLRRQDGTGRHHKEILLRVVK